MPRNEPRQINTGDDLAKVNVQTDQMQRQLERITGTFPDLVFQHAEFITKGWDHDVVILDESIVFRFPKTDEYKARFKKEVQLLAYLGSISNIPLPNYSHLPDDNSFGGYPMLEGIELTRATFLELDEELQGEVALQLGKFLSLLHQTPLVRAKEFGYTNRPNQVWYSSQIAEQTLNELREVLFSELSSAEVEWIEHQYNGFLALSHDYEPRLTHSDFTPKHILIEPSSGAVRGVIDFGDVEISDPSVDFSSFWIYSNTFPARVAAHYDVGTDSDLLERSKFPRLTYMVRRMLEIRKGIQLPVSFEDSRRLLNEVMQSDLTL